MKEIKQLISSFSGFIFFYVTPLSISFFALYFLGFYVFTGRSYIAALIWSFFVLCIPVGSIGLLTMPIRMVSGFSTPYGELIAWTSAIIFNFYTYAVHADIYLEATLTHLLYRILVVPIPNWLVIMLCTLGTFWRSLAGGNFKNVYPTQYHLINSLLVVSGFLAFFYIGHQELAIILNIIRS